MLRYFVGHAFIIKASDAFACFKHTDECRDGDVREVWALVWHQIEGVVSSVETPTKVLERYPL